MTRTGVTIALTYLIRVITLFSSSPTLRRPYTEIWVPRDFLQNRLGVSRMLLSPSQFAQLSPSSMSCHSSDATRFSEHMYHKIIQGGLLLKVADP
jgi:hypothetical protein